MQIDVYLLRYASTNELIINFSSLIIEKSKRVEKNAYKCQYWNFLHYVSVVSDKIVHDRWKELRNHRMTDKNVFGQCRHINYQWMWVIKTIVWTFFGKLIVSRINTKAIFYWSDILLFLISFIFNWISLISVIRQVGLVPSNLCQTSHTIISLRTSS